MEHPVTRSNRADGRGRGRRPEKGKSLNCGTPKLQWLSYPRTGEGKRAGMNKSFNLTKPDTLHTGTLYISALVLMLSVIPAYAKNPHEPFKWSLIRWENQKVLATFTGAGSPTFHTYLCDLIFMEPCRNFYPYYICPASNPGRSYCNYPGHFYCGYWGCETLASDWKVTHPDKYLQTHWGKENSNCIPPKRDLSWGIVEVGNCTGLTLKVLQATDEDWIVGRTWGIRIREQGADRGGHFLIKKERIPHDPLPIGPNPLLNPPLPKKEAIPTVKKEAIPTVISTVYPNNVNLTLETTISNVTVTEVPWSRDFESSRPKDPLWDLMQASYRVLNESKPNLTLDCWLCYNVKPPFFEAIGRPNKVQWSKGSNPRECKWEEQRNHTQGVTIQMVTGKGKCIGTIPTRYQPLCNHTVTNTTIKKQKSMGNKWVIPSDGAKWVCSDLGVTPCLSLDVIGEDMFCIQVLIVPRIMYHTSEEMFRHFEGDLFRQAREPITAITIGALLIAGGVGAGTGIASLIKGEEIRNLQIAVDEDLARIEQSIQNLATSVKSLSEVVLQNRRGLDLLFLKEGGLCVALKEECCSYADHTGVVQDAMAELRKRIEQRKKDREANRSWYEHWFSASPWLTTLFSTLAGPVIMIILGLMFGPCIMKYILRFVKDRFEAAKLYALTSRYNAVPIDNPDDTYVSMSNPDAYVSMSNPDGDYVTMKHLDDDYCDCDMLHCACDSHCDKCEKKFACSEV